MEAPLQDRIAAARQRLTPAELKVAALVEADAAAMPGATVASVARAAGVSEPTVIRFCRAIGLDGFSELRLAVVRAESGLPRRARPVAGIPAAEAASAVLDSGIAALEAARRALDGEAMARAALVLLRAARIEVWAASTANPAALHLEQALLGTCRGVAARLDGAMQGLVAASLDSDAAVVCLSRSGAERDLVAAARVAAGAGATVIAVTRAASPLAAAAGLLLRCEGPPEGTPGDPGAFLPFALAQSLASTAALLAPPAPARAARLDAVRRAARLIGDDHA
ncbi:MurR/RpiR family transcriptional regulator [Falsiroseomonas sp. HW251]|uniref:MurR/RpiR family transcriptional regulator n=1 Tax=Falsiroseomonas sp. HW251 TaxID=3390998 RepID=UPI003D318298